MDVLLLEKLGDQGIKLGGGLLDVFGGSVTVFECEMLMG